MSIISILLGYDKQIEPVCATLGEPTTVWAKKRRGLRQPVSFTGLCATIKRWQGKYYAEVIINETLNEVAYGPIDIRNVAYTVEEIEG